MPPVAPPTTDPRVRRASASVGPAILAMVPLTQKQWIKVLQAHGWTRETGGKHQTKMTKPGCRPITLPEFRGRSYSRRFEAAIRRQAGL